MQNFVDDKSIVRRIWGNSDVILLVFAGSAAEFALNRAVDWLFFTGNLPRDPIGRLFATVRYSQNIVFVDEQTAQATLNRISAIHGAVELKRGDRIPEWAYRDVLYMLIDYSERAYQLLHRPLTAAERQELYAVFHRIGTGLRILELPATYTTWQADRMRHLQRDLVYSKHTSMLYAQYRRHLGAWRYHLLLQVQALLVPEHVRQLLHLQARPLVSYALWTYPILDQMGLRSLVQQLLLPARYLDDVQQLDRAAAT